ncbi:MAG: hypothetical protein J7639_30630 [Paenibacillaceae bacterium]|nr:hypothetical protein [Paenibacillaceae bacterium]
MVTNRENAAPLAGLGFRAHQGGAVVVGLAVEEGEPRVVLSTLLETCSDGDRLSFEPYRVAVEMARRDPQSGASTEAAAAVAEGRRRQDRLAAQALQNIIRQLEEAKHTPVVAALLVNRAGWVTDLFTYSLAWPEHVPIAESLAVRDALRFAFRQCNVEVSELDEKSLFDLAAETLGMSAAEINARLKTLGAAVGRPWRKEQKLACLAAWVAIAGRR